MNETKYLDFVKEALLKKIEELDTKLADNEDDIKSMNDYFWENYTEFDEYGYEMYDNKIALNSRKKEREEYKKEKLRYEKMLYSPYFGRVDFCYEGEDTPETYYIGIGNLAKGRAMTPYVFDWRAPVSSLFYDYDKGPAEFLAPSGTLVGEITTKKQYKIKNGTIIYILENDMNIDDEILQQTLSEHADAALKSIVTTIQKEQNQIIRDQNHKILAVQGCAGSGKTSIALHRIAYLLYHNRKQLSAAQVLILSPNSIFADYISRILPELGEENICELTLDDFAYHELKGYGEAEDRYDEMEKLLCHGKSAVYKQTKEYIEELDGFILSLEWELVNFKSFSYRRIEISDSQISELFYEKLADVPILSRMEKIGEYLIDAEETLRNKPMSDEEKQEIFDRLNQMYETRNLIKIYNRFLSAGGRKRLELLDGKIRYEDVYPLLYLKYAILQMPKRREVKHLVIDEMQDYSYLQYVLIQKLFDCPMTILGDKVQTLAEQHMDVLSFLPKIFGRGVHCVYLNKSYRSTLEITAFANRLSQDNGVQMIERHGEEPQIIKCGTTDEMYAKMALDFEKDAEYETIAILCLTAESAKAAVKELLEKQNKWDVTLLTKDSMKFQKGISALPFYLAKGLEFDVVYVPNLGDYVTPLHKQALYINATRALHVLRLYEARADITIHKE